MITPTLRQLDIFAQMIASGSIAECARDLDVPPLEVEREIDSLEMRLGHRLFDRRGGMATLTLAGRKTVEAMQILADTPSEQWEETHAPEPDAPPPAASFPIPNLAAETIADPAQPVPTPAPGPALILSTPEADTATSGAALQETITIAAHPSIFSHFQDALAAFEQTNTDIAIALDFDTHTAAQAIPRLATGQADIAYFYTLDAPEGWPTRYAWSEQLSLYIGSRHPLAAQETVTQEDLRSVAAVMLLPGNSLRPLIDTALADAGIGGDEPADETDNLFDIMVAVRDGGGYFAAFGPMARDFARMNGIKRLPLTFPLPAVEVRQAVRAALQDSPIATALSEYLFR